MVQTHKVDHVCVIWSWFALGNL